ncbi:MAG: hypothetical protein OEV66_10605 [Spirochaetia bacterium]|nr:hypothetical protein [Spirochaetia bacterium]
MEVQYIIQARTKSTRLPDKILMKIGDKILIQHIIDRLLLGGAKKSEICFALAEENRTDVCDFLDRQGILWMCGDVYNVLARYIQASRDLPETGLVVRLTGDNPFIDFRCLKSNLEICQADESIDFSYPYKLPLGMGFEIIRKKALLNQIKFDLKPHHMEHVTSFIKENKSLFNIKQVDYYQIPCDIRLTVDYPEDLEQARKVYAYFINKKEEGFCSKEIFALYEENPEFFSLNSMIKQKMATEYDSKFN